jgi:hypothetical protein
MPADDEISPFAARAAFLRGLTPEHRTAVEEYDARARRSLRVRINSYLHIWAARCVLDTDALRELNSLHADVDEAVGHAVAALRDAGCSWAEIGESLGVGGHAAEQRWGSP